MQDKSVSTIVEPFEAAAELHGERRTWRLTVAPPEGTWFEMPEAQAEATRLAAILIEVVPVIEQWWPEIHHRLGRLQGQFEFEWQLHVDIDDARFPDHLAAERATGMAYAMHLS